MLLEKRFEEGADLGIGRNPEQKKETPKTVPENGEGMRIEKNAANDEWNDDTEIVAGQSGEIGGIRWKRTYLEFRTSCSNSACGNLLNSQYGVVEEGKENGPYYCTPECLREAKGSSL